MSNTQLTTQWRIQNQSVPHLREGQNAYAIIEPLLWPDWQEALDAYITPLDAHALMAETRLSYLPKGPLLIPLNKAQEALQACVDKMSESPCGCLVWSPIRIATDALVASLRQRLFLTTERGQALFRYYEPRTLLPLMAALSDEERQTAFPLLSHLYWHNGAWLSVSFDAPSESVQPLVPWALSQEQLSAMERIAMVMNS
ncbi:hypothetical protein TW84_10250 [Vibrio neptunius]|uniref:DUF4123 domain-containing protein n=1 Tax=Vibrio neptunius TaxID=170651 RepID=UPI0005FA6B1A|nr:DUF4123 domain-containing protein [Vibrio neptunius]KJY90569.1 hypothetical protein TW84_10250 [Vibrio neptunius]